jgi:hypothetical protein
MEAGSYTVELDASRLGQGVYFLRLVSGKDSAVAKTALVK